MTMLTPEMLEATRLTRAGKLTRATALLQRLLRGGSSPPSAGNCVDAVPAAAQANIIEVTADLVELAGAPVGETAAARPAEERAPPGRRPAPGTWFDRITPVGLRPDLRGPAKATLPGARDRTPEGGRFIAESYSNQAGSRPYKLYVPGGYHGQPLPLVIMLHGCQQSPDDFAAGTRMNLLAEEHTCLVAYPGQSASANVSRCWNWFDPRHQGRGKGEPSLITGITRRIMEDFSVDPQRIYIAGLSAGAAAAAAIGNAYPELYAAIGVHSGLACGAARDLSSAFAAMRQGAVESGRAPSTEGSGRIVPTIVFHGSLDTTVHPRNGDQVIAQSRAATTDDLRTRVERGRVPGGHAWRRTLHADAGGRVMLEQWDVDGAGHAWSGGSPNGSFTDARGPDASRQMLRFFLEHRRPGSGG